MITNIVVLKSYKNNFGEHYDLMNNSYFLLKKKFSDKQETIASNETRNILILSKILL